MSTKAGALIRRLGGAVAEPVLLPLVRGLVTATREDLIPEFRAYADALHGFGSRPNGSAPATADYAGLNANKALAFTAGHGAAPPLDLFRSLLGANALNMVRFDLRHLGDLDKPYGGDFGWLDLTHGLTFAEAVLGLCSKFPELWPAGLLQMACFAGRNTGHQDGTVDPDDWMVADPDAFFAGVERTLFDHGQDRYIVSVHLLKTALSVRSLLASPADAAGPANWRLPRSTGCCNRRCAARRCAARPARPCVSSRSTYLGGVPPRCRLIPPSGRTCRYARRLRGRRGRRRRPSGRTCSG